MRYYLSTFVLSVIVIGGFAAYLHIVFADPSRSILKLFMICGLLAAAITNALIVWERFQSSRSRRRGDSHRDARFH